MGLEEILTFVAWGVKRLLTIIAVTVGVDTIVKVYLPDAKNESWSKGVLTYRLVCFIVFATICRNIYDGEKVWKGLEVYWEIFAMVAVCVLFFMPIRAMLGPIMQGILKSFVKNDDKKT